MIRPPKAVVIGHPIKHSRSPIIHNHWLHSLNIKGSYERLNVEPQNIPDFMDDLRGGTFAGANVTLPHKEAVLAAADTASDVAKAIGAANTLIVDGKTSSVHADNTDAYGFSANLDANAPRWRDGKTALVLGAGGAARAIIYALNDVGYERIILANRTLEKAQYLASQMLGNIEPVTLNTAAEHVAASDLVINTTALGMVGQPDLSLDLSSASQSCIVTDIVYTPLMTDLLNAASNRELTYVTGLGMLLWQAVPGFEAWFGQRPQITQELFDLVLADIEGPKP